MFFLTCSILILPPSPRAIFFFLHQADVLAAQSAEITSSLTTTASVLLAILGIVGEHQVIPRKPLLLVYLFVIFAQSFVFREGICFIVNNL